jgi:NTP pyrophosphatase (non-canonical NTP hydrolase)
VKLNKYQQEASKTAIYPDKDTGNLNEINYLAMGLCAEVGEVNNKLKKIYRDNNWQATEGIAKELGDVLWYLSNLALALDIDLESVASVNLEKLKSRQERGVLGGTGDNR